MEDKAVILVVSREQAKISFSASGTITLESLSSTNATHVRMANSEELTRVEKGESCSMKIGDSIILAAGLVEYEITDNSDGTRSFNTQDITPLLKTYETSTLAEEEIASNDSKSDVLRAQLRRMVELAVNTEAGMGLDVMALVRKNLTLERELERVEKSDAEQQKLILELQNRVAFLEASETGVLTEQISQLQHQVANLEHDLSQSRNLFHSVTQNSAPLEVRKKVWKKRTLSNPVIIEEEEEEKDSQVIVIDDEQGFAETILRKSLRKRPKVVSDTEEEEECFLKTSLAKCEASAIGEKSISGEFQSFEKGEGIFNVNDNVYLVGETNTPLIGKIVRIYTKESVLSCDIQWYFRLEDIPENVR